MSQEKISQTFDRLKKNDDKAFIAYIMAGDGGLSQLEKQMKYLIEQGTDIIELGIPFSDPLADGPTIQKAGQRALAHGVTLKAILEKVASFKEQISVPIVLMGYLNPIYHLGLDQFTQLAQDAGITGIILPDLPFEEEDVIKNHLDQADIALIRLVTINSGPNRMKKLTKDAKGFIYAVTVAGTTGQQDNYSQETYDYLDQLREISPIPVCAGFGISNRSMAEKIGKHVDGVIVGSAIVNALHNQDYQAIEELIPLKNA